MQSFKVGMSEQSTQLMMQIERPDPSFFCRQESRLIPVFLTITLSNLLGSKAHSSESENHARPTKRHPLVTAF